MNWLERAAAISPLMNFAKSGSWGGESAVLEKIFSLIPRRAGFAVEFGQPSIGTGTVASLLANHGWSALYMDEAAREPERRITDKGAGIELARERVLPSNINELFKKHAVPPDLDCLVIDIDGLDYWVWQALDNQYKPSLVVVEFNVHLGPRLDASLDLDETWVYASTKDYGASLAAFSRLAQNKGYRLIHIHGPWNLYFLKADIPFPPALCVPPDLSADDFAMLTNTTEFYDALCGLGKRPSWFPAPAPDATRQPWRILVPKPDTKIVDIEGIRLEVLADKYDGTWYLQRKTFEEKQSLLYRFIRDEGFVNFVDIGANYGFISILARRMAPHLNILAVEADPRLVPLILENFKRNGLVAPTVINAVAGDEDNPQTQFSLNPSSTLDNRVAMPQWQQVVVPSIAMGNLLAREAKSGRTFFKIDTQGFEGSVLRGLENYLMTHDDWVLKMEFAPAWLQSQGTDPVELLDHLHLRYELAEFPERIAYGSLDINALFDAPLPSVAHREFVEHVEALNKDRLGWVDLILRPRLDTKHSMARNPPEDRDLAVVAAQFLQQQAGGG